MAESDRLRRSRGGFGAFPTLSWVGKEDGMRRGRIANEGGGREGFKAGEDGGTSRGAK